MGLYRKKPVVVEAIQLNPEGKNISEVYDFFGITGKGNFGETGFGIDPADGKFKITTLEGVMIADLSDYIIKGINGEFYPCKPDIFEKTYEKVDD